MLMFVMVVNKEFIYVVTTFRFIYRQIIDGFTTLIRYRSIRRKSAIFASTCLVRHLATLTNDGVYILAHIYFYPESLLVCSR